MTPESSIASVLPVPWSVGAEHEAVASRDYYSTQVTTSRPATQRLATIRSLGFDCMQALVQLHAGQYGDPMALVQDHSA